MHDPSVVAFEVRRPWPRRVRWGTGRRWYFPAIVTVWHVEPGGHDSGEVCRHYDHVTNKARGGWRWHVHHWRLQIHPLRELRRRLLTRCSWCGGRSTRRDAVDTSHSWDGPRGRWWQGEPGLYHTDCSGVARAHLSCACADPLLPHDGYGTCVMCGKSYSWGRPPSQLPIIRSLQTIPAGTRDRGLYEQVIAGEVGNA